MTAEDRIDRNLDAILRASGSALKNYSWPPTLKLMRDTMRGIMTESYILGSNDAYRALTMEEE